MSDALDAFLADRSRLSAYLRDLADRMGLRDWEINVADGPLDDKTNAGEVHVVYGRRIANIAIDPKLAADGADEVRHVCTHELLHCHFKAFQWCLANVETHLGPPVYNLLFNSYKDAEELAIDAVATALARHLPLPPIADSVTEPGSETPTGMR